MIVRLLLAALLIDAALHAEPVRETVTRGNGAWHTMRCQDALRAYEKAAALQPGAPEIQYNLGTALYRLGEFPRALEQFERAAAAAKKGRLPVLAHYNSANSAFQHAMSLVRSDPRSALALLERAAEHATEALRLDPKYEDAAHNLTVIKHWLKLVEEQLKQSAGLAPSGAASAGSDASGASFQELLGQEARNRSRPDATSRPTPVEKDW